MSRPTIDEYYVKMLSLIASRGTCLRRKVAAILVDEEGKLVATGYNGVPRGMSHCIDIPCLGAGDKPGDNSRCLAIHAEANAILQAADSRRKPHTLYCSCTPCFNCAKLLITAGVKEVTATSLYQGDIGGCQLLDQVGINVKIYSVGGRLMPWETFWEPK